MLLSHRTKSSLCQLLNLFGLDVVEVLVSKHGIAFEDVSNQAGILDALSGSENSSMASLVEETAWIF